MVVEVIFSDLEMRSIKVGDKVQTSFGKIYVTDRRADLLRGIRLRRAYPI